MKLYTKINPVYILAISMIGTYQADTEFRRQSLISLQNMLSGFIALRSNITQCFFDEYQIN